MGTLLRRVREGLFSLFFLLILTHSVFASPTLSWNTFLGGSGQHLGYAITVDSDGKVYVAGLHNTNWNTSMFGSPIGNVGFQGGASDGVVAKLNSSGSVLWYRFFGGATNDALSGVKVDASGNVYVIGYAFGAFTNLSDSPVHSYVGGDIDIFVAKLNSSGTLLWDTYLGSSSNDYGYGIDIDASGNVYVGGESYHQWDSSFNNVKGTDKSSDGYQGYIVKLNSNGVYQWHRFLTTYGVYDVDAGDDGYLYTIKKGLAYVSGAWNYPAEVGKYDTSTGAQSWSYQIGSGTHDAFGIKTDGNGNVFIKGISDRTWGTSPVRAYTSGNDTYVAKLNSSGTLQWNTFLGGSGNDNCRSSNACTMGLDTGGNIYVTGFSTASWGSPVTAFAGGTSDGFAAEIDSTGALLWNTFLGGTNADQCTAMTTSSGGDVYTTGYTQQTSWGSPVNFPTNCYYCQSVTKLSNSTTLTITKSGNGGGTVTSNPAGINCGSTCTQSTSSGASIVLTATSASGSAFTGWSGGGCSGTDTCTVTMSQNRSVTATFDPSSYTLTASKLGTGSGAITSSPSGISCGSTCSTDFNASTDVTLTATPSTGSIFSGWGGTAGCSGTGSCTTTMNAARSVTGTFTLDGYSITLIKSGSGSGTITSSPSGINCGSTCSATYDYGTSVTLTGTAGSNSVFSGWGSGSGCTGTSPCTVTVDSAKSVNATFSPRTYTLTVIKSGGGSATVSSSVAGINCGSTCSAAYNTGTSVTLSVSAASGSTFAGWSGGGCSGAGSCTMNITANTSVTAGIVSGVTAYQSPTTGSTTSFMLAVAKTGNGSGTVTSSPSGISCGSTCSKSYGSGTPVTLTAAAGGGSTFAGWSGGVCSGTSSCSVTLSSMKMVTATFTSNSGDSGSSTAPPVINDISNFQMGCTPGTPCAMPTWSVTSSGSAAQVSKTWTAVADQPIGFTSDGQLDLVNYHPPRGTYYAQYVATDNYGTASSLPVAISIPNNSPVIANNSDLTITGATLEASKFKMNQFARNMDIKASFTDYDSDNLSYSWQVKNLDIDKAGFISTSAGSSILRSRIAGNVTVLVSADDGNGGTTTEEIVVSIPVPDITSDELNVNIDTLESDETGTLTVTGTLQSSVWPVAIVNGETTASVALATTTANLTRDAVVEATPVDDENDFRAATTDAEPAADDTVGVTSDMDTYSFTATGVPVGTDSSQINVDVYTAVDGENVFLANTSLAVIGSGSDGTGDTGGGTTSSPGLHVSATSGCALHAQTASAYGFAWLLAGFLLLPALRIIYRL